jgi:hypothetical protein
MWIAPSQPAERLDLQNSDDIKSKSQSILKVFSYHHVRASLRLKDQLKDQHDDLLVEENGKQHFEF